MAQEKYFTRLFNNWPTDANSFCLIHGFACGRGPIAILLIVCFCKFCSAQSYAIPTEVTPWQRWLPPPQSVSGQHAAQARLLSQFRDLVLNSDSKSQSGNPSRLSDSDVQLLKKAMKQFGGNLPDGLSPDVLDSIPPEVISKALSNPELMRQAREMAEKYLNKIPPKSSDGSGNSGDRPQRRTTDGNESSPGQAEPVENNKGRSPTLKDGLDQSPKPSDDTAQQSKSNSNDYKELINKLLKTQEQYEKSQREARDSSQSGGSEDSDLPIDNDFNPLQQKGNPSEATPSIPSSTGTDQPIKSIQKPGATQPKAGSGNASSRATPSAIPQTGSPQSSSPPRNRTIPAANSPTPESRSTQPMPTPQRNRLSPNTPKSDSFPIDPQSRDARPMGNGAGEPTSNANNKSSSRDYAGDSNSLDAKDIRQELDRKGLGSALQKIFEESRANIAKRAKSNGTQADGNVAKAANTSSKTKSPSQELELANRSTNAATPPNSTAAPDSNFKPAAPRTPQPESDFSKGLKQAGNYFNKLWTQVAKSSTGTTSTSSTTALSPQESPANDAINLPNPFDVRVLPYLLVFALLCAIVFFAIRYRVRSEQVQRATQLAKLEQKLDEIQTRDDFVIAFHSLARLRFQAAQAWWTCGYVATQFETKLPQCKSPIQTLVNLYDQARYFPMEHQLTAKQIDDAKLALKQCKG